MLLVKGLKREKLRTLQLTHPLVWRYTRHPLSALSFYFSLSSVICTHGFQTVMWMWPSGHYYLWVSTTLKGDVGRSLSREWLRLNFKEMCIPPKTVHNMYCVFWEKSHSCHIFLNSCDKNRSKQNKHTNKKLPPRTQLKLAIRISSHNYVGHMVNND